MEHPYFFGIVKDHGRMNTMSNSPTPMNGGGGPGGQAGQGQVNEIEILKGHSKTTWTR